MSCYDCERQINRAIKAFDNKLFEQILFEDYSNDNTKDTWLKELIQDLYSSKIKILELLCN